MTEAASTTRPLVTARYLALRLGLGVLLIAAAAAWQLGHGARFAFARFSLHAPRFELLAAASAVIQLHVAAAVSAFVIGCMLLAGVKGTAVHKALGWGWVASMATVAVSSLFIKVLNPGHWSFIHFLSGWVIIALPIAVVAIKRRNVKLHRRMMTGMFVGGLVIAGAFTFVPGRLMYQVFFG